MNVKVIARYAVLILAIVNQWLADHNMSPIPVDEDTISTTLLTVIALYTAWKDNPVTKEAQWANQKLKKYKAENKIAKATGQAPATQVDPINLDELKQD